MKILTILLLLLIFIFEPDYSAERIKGGFNNCSMFQIIYDNETMIESTKTLIYARNLDSYGNTTEIIHYNPDVSIFVNELYKYDNQNLIEVLSLISNGKTHKMTYKFDDRGNEIEWIVYNSDSSIYRKESYTYDNQNNIIEKIDYNSDGSVSLKCIYSYHEGNNDIIKYYNSKNLIVGVIKSKFDRMNNKVESITYNTDGSIFDKEINVFDINGSKVESVFHKHDGYVYKEINKYDVYGNKTEWIKFNKYNMPAEKYIYIYTK